MLDRRVPPAALGLWGGMKRLAALKPPCGWTPCPSASSTAEFGSSTHPDLRLPPYGEKATAVTMSGHKDNAMPGRADKSVSLGCLGLASAE